MAVIVYTNRRWRDPVEGTDAPAEVRKQFDYASDEDFAQQQFIKYRGSWYCLGDFQVTSGELSEWDGFWSDTYFSGVLMKVDKHGAVMMGRYYSTDCYAPEDAPKVELNKG